jgi:methylmalonyl-CoA/ethylmalonyl-CoA epimerase
MINKFDHVGLAVKNADETVSVLSRLFGFEVAESRAEPAAGFKSTLISKADVTLELIEPLGSQGMIQKFVEKRGEGLHHISIQVTDLEEEMKRLLALGVQFIGEKPAQVTDTTKVIFIHPRSTNGLLIELIQRDHL